MFNVAEIKIYIYVIVAIILFPGFVIAQKGGVKIGDPKELFLDERPPPIIAEKDNEKLPSPKSYSEFFNLMKKDIKKTLEDIKEIRKEKAKQKRHTYHDSDFTPPRRPDWR